ncbi:30S ribosomal protein S16 [Candidatus Karelsulcia muelleri]|uniref:30S ribosomal protein S16 n=1 Tax=Candidatus Karelsulcia muelleri TaxID=336810 RepID=UPI00204F86D7|nr:30S ribosomal protein S16 [Candidatus Karelsulcia muelleri]
MSLRIRLQRKGKKKQPFYSIVIANSNSPRDGKFIEKIGIYNPVQNPYIVEVNVDKAIYWLEKGAQPTNTVKSFLYKKGVFYKKHFLNGVKKI